MYRIKKGCVPHISSKKHLVCFAEDDLESRKGKRTFRPRENIWRAMDYNYLFKIILIGDANVGKTCLVRRFTKGYFPPSQGPTIGVDFTIKSVEVDGEEVKVNSSTYLVHYVVRY